MASQNLLTPESEIRLPRVRTVDRERSEQRAHAWIQRYGVRDSRRRSTAVKYLSYEDDKPPAERSDDTPFIREKSDDISSDSQQVVQEAAGFDRSKFPDGIFHSGTFPLAAGAVETVGKGTVQQFPPSVVTMPQSDRHTENSPDVAAEGLYRNQRKDLSDITLQGTFQPGTIQHGTADGTFQRHFSDYLADEGRFSTRHYSTNYYGRHFFPRHFSDFRNEGRSISGRHCSTRYHGRHFHPRHFFDCLANGGNFNSALSDSALRMVLFIAALFKPAYRTEELFSKVLPQDHFYTELIGKKDL
jgi:hypothetical protein